MPKTKKQKTHHHHANATNGELTHEEIWDDSALLRSWNDAVKEYEYYHSIHARGEDVEEVLRQAELAEQAQTTRQSSSAKNARRKDNDDQEGNETSADEGEIDSDNNDVEESRSMPSATANGSNVATNQESTLIDSSNPMETAPAKKPVPGSTPTQTTQRATAAAGDPDLLHNEPETGGPVNAPSAAALSTDQALENIKMAYYWAGYYSGLYDGQRQVSGQAQRDAKDGT